MTKRRRSARIQEITEEKSKVLIEQEKKLLETIDISSDEDDQTDDSLASSDDDTKPRRKAFKKKRKQKDVSVKIKLAPIFLNPKERRELEKAKDEKPNLLTTVMSEAKKSFLYSGLPDVTVKKQKIVEKKQAEAEILQHLEMFPRITHTASFLTSRPWETNIAKLPFSVTSAASVENDATKLYKIGLPTATVEVVDPGIPLGEFCCGLNKHFPSERLKGIQERHLAELDPTPWQEKYRIKRQSQLVIEKDSLSKFLSWMKQWGKDIKSDGGTTRKTVQKKRKRRDFDSDSDFIDNDDEAVDLELKSKSVILAGPSGSGKSAMVYITAKRFGFKVVEMNFSSPRSGQEVIRQVEEATLSRRLTGAGTVDVKHCLLLFKDIDQEVEEDEGFHAAVAQLITASCRPIVMTVTKPTYSVIDFKIERKEPLWISVALPDPVLAVSKILLPILEHVIEEIDQEYELDDHPQDELFLRSVLDSIVRHSGRDIRKSINQMQILWSTSSFTLRDVHRSLCSKFDVEFVAPHPSETASLPVEEIQSKPTQKAMRDIVRHLELLTDLDIVAARSSLDSESDEVPRYLQSYFDLNFSTMLQNVTSENEDGESSELISHLRSLTLETDKNKLDLENLEKLHYDLVDSYVESGEYETFEEVGYIRTIVKTSLLSSAVLKTKRNGRLPKYLPGMSHLLCDLISDTYDFSSMLQLSKQIEVIDL